MQALVLFSKTPWDTLYRAACRLPHTRRERDANQFLVMEGEQQIPDKRGGQRHWRRKKCQEVLGGLGFPTGENLSYMHALQC